MRLLLALVAVAGLVGSLPVWAEERLGEDSEFAEARYSCYGEDAEDEAGSPEAVAEVCKQVEAQEAAAKADGICWADERMSWEKCK